MVVRVFFFRFFFIIGYQIVRCKYFSLFPSVIREERMSWCAHHRSGSNRDLYQGRWSAYVESRYTTVCRTPRGFVVRRDYVPNPDLFDGSVSDPCTGYEAFVEDDGIVIGQQARVALGEGEQAQVREVQVIVRDDDLRAVELGAGADGVAPLAVGVLGIVLAVLADAGVGADRQAPDGERHGLGVEAELAELGDVARFRLLEPVDRRAEPVEIGAVLPA
jgi:hypothetical protein